MANFLLSRLRQGHRTVKYPKDDPPSTPERFRGLPEIRPRACAPGCAQCAAACPTGAIEVSDRVQVDLGRCLFCNDCESACPEGALRCGRDYRLATRSREDLVFDGTALRLAEAVDERTRKLFGRSFKVRQVSAGGCNACEADVNVLNTVGWDLGRFGIQFVASPRHADGLWVTGPVTENMVQALLKTYEAIPPPKLVIASGACALSGGPYAGHPEVRNGAATLVPVDLFIPGCPPHPLTVLDGLLRLFGKISR